MQFVAGDTVRLKSGSPLMTVEVIDSNGVHCTWFEGNKVCRDRFPDALLEKGSEGLNLPPLPRR